MKSSGESIQRLLTTLAKHGDVVAEAFGGPVATGGDRQRDAGIAALAGAGALKPYEENSYYLSTELYDFISARLASFNAFQALTRIASFIYQAGQQWDELVRLNAARSNRDAAKLEAALERSVIEIGDTVERNITLLNTMVLAQYGDVDNFNSKLRQNRFYDREVTRCLRELEQVDALVQQISDQSIAAGLPRMRQLALRRLGTQLLPWTSRLKDAQAVISRRLFDAKLMERKLKLLSRYAGWLTSNRTADGWDVDVTADAPAALFRPEDMKQRPQPDTRDPDPGNQEKLLAAAGRMPAKAVEKNAAFDDAAGIEVIAEDMETVEQVLEPYDEALQDLVDHLRDAPPRHLVSLAQWKETRPALQEVTMENWLLYATLQLRSGEFSLRFLSDEVLEEVTVNATFHDVEVMTPSHTAAS